MSSNGSSNGATVTPELDVEDRARATAAKATPPPFRSKNAKATPTIEEVARLGYYRGVLNQLQSLQKQYPQCAAFIAQQEALARQYQFETMVEQLQNALAAGPGGDAPEAGALL